MSEQFFAMKDSAIVAPAHRRGLSGMKDRASIAYTKNPAKSGRAKAARTLVAGERFTATFKNRAVFEWINDDASGDLRAGVD